MILKVGVDSLQKVESEFTKIIDSTVGRDEKFRKLFSLMAEGHVETQSIRKEGFVGLAIQNAELNAELKEQNKALKDQLTCKPRVKVPYGPFQGDGGNNKPPPEDGKFDASEYKGGPNLFIDKFDYDNPNHTRENTDFSSQKCMNHAYDRHAKKCFGMKENRNKESLKKFKGKARSFIESPETEKINGSYRYETPAYFYKEKDGNLVAIVNATDNSFITVVNGTESQLKSIQENNNFGLDTRPSM